MARSISSDGKIPFGSLGINVNAVKLPDGTALFNLKIYGQRSRYEYDLIDPSTGIIYQHMQITSKNSLNQHLDINASDQDLVLTISNGSFFIKRRNPDNTPFGFVLSINCNLVKTSHGVSYFAKPKNYIELQLFGPQPHKVHDGITGEQTVYHKPNGHLYVGNGISSDEMIVSTDGLIELAIAIRYWQSTFPFDSIIVPENNVYSKVLETNGDWTIPFSIGLLSSSDIGYITDFYDVNLYFYGSDDGTENPDYLLKHTLITDGGEYKLVPDISDIDPIVDSYVDPMKRFMQNSSRYKFYSGHFVNPEVPTGQIPLGLYKLKLVAVHKATGLTTTAQCWANISR